MVREVTKSNFSVPGKCRGKKSLNTTAMKAIHFPTSPLHKIDRNSQNKHHKNRRINLRNKEKCTNKRDLSPQQVEQYCRKTEEDIRN